MKKSEKKQKCVSWKISPKCRKNNEEWGIEVQMSSINDSKKKNASGGRQSSAKKGNDTRSGSKKSSRWARSAEAKDKKSITVSVQVAEGAAIAAGKRAKMVTRAKAKKDANGNAKDAVGNAKLVRIIAKGATKKAKLKSKGTGINAKDSKKHAKSAKIKAKDKGIPESSTIHKAKQKSPCYPHVKNASMKISLQKKNDSREVASAESTSVVGTRHSARRHINHNKTEQTKLKRGKTKVLKIAEKRINKARREKNCKVKNEQHQLNKKKSNTIKKKKKLNSTDINEIQVKNNIYICKFKNKLNKIRKYFFPIFMYGEASIARNKAVLLMIHMHTCLYCQNGVLCNFVENYTL
ncbi:conserved Plasmodium protein, unknown function [Plasmodium knowlesi strain H]|uniref:Uncharacterized protein n=3 Tax=Plasmodium knowlesi TaxID=5850 RepID=A0A5K1UMW1_PLAKH|nr:conserved Plasmodium protein, unknown function [Plasmodium knowlesi strain H]OTN68068.1 Uncharacterized protein PKNOH_S04367500 [Plasmodium knowlesi]CAA9987035.1 conserved Plasmodium protein, unknown function [Plasmodium knowlesi strain H]SBO26715.1 conserved Plasmodium protein, unknown function [Plasmodium knowlesi strain H]SBO28240.1 conserved Plasmodium protein, unknown function [Plasmodium knowlesi strain H]VVS76509.1 conserved Plasmodium protein, unknown function [Plasmodium knowlesi s|eukprot:XP_002258280.1 hypothetical protein, conserved in Plasmodium species [Plasmodium knowlesi strain H]